MTYLRLPVTEVEADPVGAARSVFGAAGWRDRYPILDVAEAWQGLHYLITGDPWEGAQPAADAVCGGRLLTEDGAEEFGLDVLYLAPDRVKLAADHLRATSFASIAERYDPARMAELEVLGAAQWAQKAPATVRDKQLRPLYGKLVGFFDTAATEGQAIYKAMG